MIVNSLRGYMPKTVHDHGPRHRQGTIHGREGLLRQGV